MRAGEEKLSFSWPQLMGNYPKNACCVPRPCFTARNSGRKRKVYPAHRCILRKNRRQGYVDYEIGHTWQTSIVAHEIVDEWYANVLLYHRSDNSAVEYFDIFSGPDEICLKLQALFDECDKSRI